METLDWIVIAGGIAAIVWVNWYFLFAGRDHQAVIRSAARDPHENRE